VKVDVCVIGAGPAGLGASTVLARFGLRVVVVDEAPEPGGRLLGQLHRIGRRNDAFHQDGWWHGRRIAAMLAEEATKAGVTFLQGASVWGIYPGWQVCITGDEPRIIEAERLIIATGASEVPLPMPGWTLPGVMTIGAAQVLATQHRVRPGRNGIVVGINPLSLAIAHELHLAGTEVAAIVNVPPGPLSPPGQKPAAVIAELARASHLAPSRLLRIGGRLGTNSWAARIAVRLQPPTGLRVWGMPLNPRRAATAILGSRQVEGVVLADLSPEGEVGSSREIAVDAVFLAGGLRPLSELAMLAGCHMIAAPDLGGTIPLHGPALETTAPGVWVAGNVAGIESAAVALAQGRLAAIAIVDPPRVGEYQGQLAQARRDAPIDFLPKSRRGHETVARVWDDMQRSGNLCDGAQLAMTPPRQAVKSHQADALRELDEHLVLCRCEGVTVGMVRRVARQGFSSAEEIKRFTRMTMGACQGRVCQSVLERIQAADGGVPINGTAIPGHRPPVRPVALAELAALATGDEEWERLHGALLPSAPFDDPARRLGDPRF
jgi:sarcosine oxidase, subunit alpha